MNTFFSSMMFLSSLAFEFYIINYINTPLGYCIFALKTFCMFAVIYNLSKNNHEHNDELSS